MIYVLENENLKVEITDLGAELQSIKGKKSGFEYLWQGKEPFWKSRSTVLFPICGRLFEGKYTYKGKTYEMLLHGFAKKSVFKAEKVENYEITFLLTSSEETKTTYPFDFEFRVTYKLEKNKLTVTFDVKNDKEEMLPFSVGGHPGFNVPLLSKGEFTDCYLEFAEPCKPERMIMTQPSYLYSGDHVPFELEGGKILRLKHDLFDEDAIFLRNTAKEVSLKSEKCDASVTVSFGDMCYVGFWHNPFTEAPFVCIEPWHGIPALEGVTDDFADKYLQIKLKKGESYSTYFDITVKE